MPILESPPFALSIGITVQPIVNHGRDGWRIFKPSGDYVCQFTAEAAARTAIRWSGKQVSAEAIIAELNSSAVANCR